MPRRPISPPPVAAPRPTSSAGLCYVEIDARSARQALGPWATRVVSALGGQPMKFVEVHGPNQHYDFHWRTMKDGVVCLIRGDYWEADEPQGHITVTLSGPDCEALQQALHDKASALGWAVLPLNLGH